MKEKRSKNPPFRGAFYVLICFASEKSWLDLFVNIYLSNGPKPLYNKIEVNYLTRRDTNIFVLSFLTNID